MRHPVSTISASLAAASLVAITQILTTTPDKALLVAVWIFAFCLPLLVSAAIHSPVKRVAPFSELTVLEKRAFGWVLYVVLCDVVGFALVFFHFGIVAGVAFLLSCLLALGAVTDWNPNFLAVAAVLITYPISLIRLGLEKLKKHRQGKA